MKKLTIGIIISAILIVTGFIIYRQFNSDFITLNPCHGYEEVGSFDEEIKSEEDVIRIALNYYFSIGYEFELEDLIVSETDTGWSIRFDRSRIEIQDFCLNSANPPDCIGQELKLEGNKILMEYQIPC